jgi:outer membrane protein OmpA-like peptidoglycan-associated protein
MAQDLLQPALHWLSPGLLQKLAGHLGESPDATRTALNAAAPALLGGMIKNGSTMSGAENMVGAIRRSGVDATYLEHADEVLAGGAPMDRASSAGADLLPGFLGGMTGSVADFLARFANIRLDSATKLLGLIAPTLAAGLARAAPGGLNAPKLMSVLDDQRDVVRRHAPPGLAPLVGLTDRPAAGAAMRPPEKRGAGIWPWLVGLGAAALLLLFGLNQCVRREAQPPQTAARRAPAEPVAPTAPPQAPAARAPMAPAAPAAPGMEAAQMEQLRFPDGTTISVVRGGVNESLHRFLTSPEATPRTFTFDRINFEARSAALTPDSTPTIDGMAAILRAYPSAAVRIEGHTDSEGDVEPNQTLSEARARRIADMLAARGVAAGRVETVGYGETRPVASNDTEAGRAQNRRIELVVTRK